MPVDAFLLALGAAVLHALWNVLLGRERDPEAATAVALLASVILFARGLAPVLVLVIGVVLLGAGAGVAQALGVCLVGGGVLLVRGFGAGASAEGVGFGIAVATCIAAYTLVDKDGIEHASPIVYLELGMAPAAAGYVLVLLALPRGSRRLRAAARPVPATAGILSFVAYALVLAALARASAASVAAVRETSVLIAAALAAPLLGEPVGRGRLVGAALVVAGVALIALA